MTSLESLLNPADLAYRDVPELSAYLTSPTSENARRLLLALEIYIPYTRINASRRAPTAPARRHGADRDAFRLHALVKFIHDIHQNARIPEIVLARILGTSATPELLALCKKSEPITAQLTALLQRHYQIESKPTELKADQTFHELVANWMRQSHLQIVLDGILAPLSDDTANKPETARTLIFCAFLQLLLTGYNPMRQATTLTKRPRGDSTTGNIKIELIAPPNTITFLTGTVQYLEGGGWDAFFNRWRRSLKKDSVYLALVERIELRPISVASMWAPFGDDVSAVTDDGITLGPTRLRVPYRRPNPPKATPPRPDFSSDANYFREEAANIHVTYTKDYLANLMKIYTGLNRIERSAPEISQFIDQLIAVNAFRDRYKADVAIQKDAVFVTLDRLALVYYTMRAHEQNRPNRGLFLYPEGLRTMAVETDRI